MRARYLLVPLMLVGVTLALGQGLKTRWAAGVTPANVHREYPRPQMVRPNWVNLNGTWSYRIGTRDTGNILVPFPVESQLSGVGKSLNPGEWLTYARTFSPPKGDRVLLHIGASDWKTNVLVDDTLVVDGHEGGYDPIDVDITSAIKKGSRAHTLIISVQDPSDGGPQPRGKQVRKPGGIFYTSTSGIWQTVWMEGVPSTYIEKLKIETQPAAGQVNLTVSANGTTYAREAKIQVLDKGKIVAEAKTKFTQIDFHTDDPHFVLPAKLTIKVPNAKWWSPESPYLYDLKVTVKEQTFKGEQFTDTVSSYFAFRTATVQKDKDGKNKFFLNGKPYFLMGTLDQGFWPDGLYTAPSDAALKYDLDVQKRLGFNFIRKHVKVEPDRWYYWCDRLGLLVLQDMPSGDRSIGPDDPDIQRTPESQAIFKKELKAMIDHLWNHPSIFGWVVYNEGWGQWNTAEMSKWTKEYDPSRVVDAVTGWSDRNVGDFKDWHIYPGPGAPSPDPNRAIFLGEYGGLGLPVPGHMWKSTGWGYQSYKTSDELTNAFCDLMFQLRLLRATGLSGAVYTQTTDVETELNGLMTYDRAMLKMNEGHIREAIADVYKPAPNIETIVPTSEETPQTWFWTIRSPGRDWATVSSWPGEASAPGGFGTSETPGSVVHTVWRTPDIWIRRDFTTNASIKDAYLRISYDDDVEAYLDGKLVYKAPGWTTSYKFVKIGVLKAGQHDLRIHVHQNSGGQFVDAGIVRIR